MRHFRQRVVLIHELGQLAGAEEFLDRRRHRLGVDHVLHGQIIRLNLGQALLDRPLHPGQPRPEGLLHLLADAAHPAIAQVIHIVHDITALVDINQNLQHIDDVLDFEDPRALHAVTPQPAIQPHPPHRGEVVALRVEEQVVEIIPHRLRRNRFAGAQDAVNVGLGFQGHRLRAVSGRTEVEVVRAQGAGNALGRFGILDDFESRDRRAHQFPQQVLVEQGVETQPPVDLPGFRVEQVARQCAIIEERGRNLDFLLPRLQQLLHVDRHEGAPGPHFHAGLLCTDVERQLLALEVLHPDEEPAAQRQGNGAKFRQFPGPGRRQLGAGLDRDAVFVQQRQRQFLPDQRSRTRLPSVRVEDIRVILPAGRQQVLQEVLRRQHALHPGLGQLGDRGRRHLLALVQDHVSLSGIHQRECRLRTLKQRQRNLAPLLHPHRAARREGFQNLLFRHADRAQQDRRRNLAAAVDPQVQQVLVIEPELQPGPIFRFDSGVVEDLARGMASPLVVGEDDARRLQQLGYDHPFRAIDHERAMLGHQRDVAQVHILFLDFLDLARCALGRILLVDDHPRLDPQGRHVCLAPPLALAHVEARLSEFVLQAAQLDMPGMADNRERRVQYRLDALVLAFLRRHVGLQESAVRLALDLQHVRNREHFRKLSEIFPNAFFLGVGIRHAHLSDRQLKKRRRHARRAATS